ncbi:hypothetical protein [cf. Phormidesmis sp. LEGE 11477]|uniref:hypothetical protein n=1 Tax=cf. Phormidesmis sp. LEGE 11477 TaxID=1828680 RepID=UPI00187E844E|nr:hypothetical protein [cf. Phormidesmis sp. LEGE 11477]MBE9059513.1 hypothetical protein [cf. Phormidesmis sp. LEGE 11477]
MGISTYYEVVPDSILSQLSQDEELRAVFSRLWGYGSGMYWWFKQIDDGEIEEITEGQSPVAIQRLRERLLNVQRFPTGYLEKTHEIHEALLLTAFNSRHEAQANELARIAISGAERWVHETEPCYESDLYIVSHQISQQLAELMKHIEIERLVASFDLGSRRPIEAWRESLTSELQGLIDCYRAAAEFGHSVLVGIS